MPSYYNENDPKAAAWLRALIEAELIADGTVDERSICDVRPKDLYGFEQVHFFAGIAGWAYALRLAGWPAGVPVWTGSCPCQPFSAAGKGKGEKDERHLWPEMRRLIDECGPAIVFGEQVASKAGRGWLDRVRLDLEEMGYAVGAADLCAAGVNAPHIRQRLYWLAYAGSSPSWNFTERRKPDEAAGSVEDERQGKAAVELGRCSSPYGMAYTGHDERSSRPARGEQQPKASIGKRTGGDSSPSGMGNSGIEPCERNAGSILGTQTEVDGERIAVDGNCSQRLEHASSGLGFWSSFELIPCRDGKSRRVEPGTFPLAHGVPGRVAQLRGLGNAIVPQVAAEFIGAFLETLNEGKFSETSQA